MPTRLDSRATRVAVLCSALVASAASQSLRAQSPAESAYDRVARAWISHETLEAQFEQRITNPLLGRTATSRGTFLQHKPGRVSITFSDPMGDRIVGDGQSLWVYLPSSAPGQVMKLPADADGAVVVDLLGQLLDAPKRTFTITGGESTTIEGRATKRVMLVPRVEGRVPFQKATLWLDDKDPRPVRVQVTDVQGVERMITLTTWIPNAVLPPNAFVFKAPKGVKVITKIPGV
ncbi:MAG: outer membrane lipoprotein carrier protein LolA [Gemmatimonadaceae bacterium]|nr:outer membrane lipoprotein carrier protein LolA [Gemmatimonadaceae bacterium]